MDLTEGAIEMQLEHFTFGSCSARGYSDFYLEVTAEHAEDNINFEVEQLGDTTDPEALSVSYTTCVNFSIMLSFLFF